jgi:hypothetical protein
MKKHLAILLHTVLYFIHFGILLWRNIWQPCFIPLEWNNFEQLFFCWCTYACTWIAIVYLFWTYFLVSEFFALKIFKQTEQNKTNKQTKTHLINLNVW